MTQHQIPPVLDAVVILNTVLSTVPVLSRAYRKLWSARSYLLRTIPVRNTAHRTYVTKG